MDDDDYRMNRMTAEVVVATFQPRLQELASTLRPYVTEFLDDPEATEHQREQSDILQFQLDAVIDADPWNTIDNRARSLALAAGKALTELPLSMDAYAAVYDVYVNALTLYSNVLIAQGNTAFVADRLISDVQHEFSIATPIPSLTDVQEELAAGVVQYLTEQLEEGDLDRSTRRMYQVTADSLQDLGSPSDLPEALFAFSTLLHEKLPGSEYWHDIAARAQELYITTLDTTLQAAPEALRQHLRRTINSYLPMFLPDPSELPELLPDDEWTYEQWREYEMDESVNNPDALSLHYLPEEFQVPLEVPPGTVDSMSVLMLEADPDAPEPIHHLSPGQAVFKCTNTTVGPHYYDAVRYEEYCNRTVSALIDGQLQKKCVQCQRCFAPMDRQIYRVLRRSNRLPPVK